MRTKKILVATLFATCVLSWCIPSTMGVENPIDMGTIDYRDFEYVELEGSGQIDLDFVTSDIPVDALDKIFVSFYPGENITKYKFISMELDVEYGFIPKVNNFYYQDETTGQLYVISIDHSDVVVPPLPLELEYENLLENYENLSIMFSNISNVYENLSSSIETVNNILMNYTNITGMSLDVVVQSLFDEYQNLNDTYNNMKDSFENVWDDYNDTNTKYTDLNTEYILLFNDYRELNETYNTTFNNLLNVSANLSTYEAFAEHLSDPILKKGFYFQGDYFRPVGYYLGVITNQRDTIDWNNLSTPIFLFLSILFTLIICYLIAKRYYTKLTEQIELDEGYSENTKKFNKWILFNKIKESLSIKKKTTNPTATTQQIVNPSKPEIIQTPSPVETQNTETKTKASDENIQKNSKTEKIDIKNLPYFEEILPYFEEITDKKINPIRDDITALHNSIDLLLHQNGLTPGADETP